jgi:26S proteasome regulatory subunit N9
MTTDDRLLRAHDLGISAFLGDTIYNFGELVRHYGLPVTMNITNLNFFFEQLMHPILNALDGTQHEWIKKLLFTFNEGSIGKFEALAPLFPKEVRGPG